MPIKRVENESLDDYFCEHSIYTLDDSPIHQHIFIARASSKRNYLGIYLHHETRKLVLARRVDKNSYVILTSREKFQMRYCELRSSFKYIKKKNKDEYEKLRMRLITCYYPVNREDEYKYSSVLNLDDCLVLSEEDEKLLRIRTPSLRRRPRFH